MSFRSEETAFQRSYIGFYILFPLFCTCGDVIM